MNGMMEPEIRFEGYDGEWKNHILIDIASFKKGQGYSKADLRNDGNPIILYGQMYTKYQVCIAHVDTYVIKKEGSILSKGKEIIIPASGETAEDIACASVVRQEGVILGGDLNIIVLDNNYSPEFAALSLTYGEAHKELTKVAQGKTVVHLHNSEIANAKISFPIDSAEQQQIASYFTSLDNLIQSATKKIASLKQLKSASLISMFPQAGETKPRVRFKGFHGDWASALIADKCKIGTGKSNTQDQVENGEFPFFIRSENIVKSNKYLYDCEAVITIGDGNIGKVFHYVNGKFDLHQRCYKMTDFSDEISGEYFFYFFSNFFYERAIKMSAKATVDSVRLDMIADMQLKFPPLAEQKAIAAYFKSLDTLIQLIEKKNESLKQIKSACLDKMFV